MKDLDTHVTTAVSAVPIFALQRAAVRTKELFIAVAQGQRHINGWVKPQRVGFEAVRSAMGWPAWARSRWAQAKALSAVFQSVLREKRITLSPSANPGDCVVDRSGQAE